MNDRFSDHPRWAYRSAPDSASWTNAIDGIFSKLARWGLKAAVFNLLDICMEATEACLRHQSEQKVRPFKWSGKAYGIIDS